MASAAAKTPDEIRVIFHPIRRELVLKQARHIEDLISQLEAFTTRVAQLEE